MPNYFPEIDPDTGDFLSPLVQDAIDARAAAAGSVGHNHDDRYYTEAEADARFVRTVNGAGPDGAGNVAVEAGSAVGDLDDVPDSATRLALTPAERSKLGNTTGTNTGDQTLPTWTTIDGKPAVIADGADAAEARGKIGAVDQAAIDTAITNLINGAPGALDTLNELSSALGGDANFSATTAAALANRLRTDAAQTIADGGAQARSNLGLGTAAMQATSAFATSAQGTKADSAVQPATATTVTVGSGGTYATIGAALAALSRLAPVYVSGGLSVTVQLLAGFVMAEQVSVTGIDLGWIRIASVDPVVTINRSALTVQSGRWYSAFHFKDGATGPKIDCKFSMDTTGTGTLRTGFYVIGGSTAIFGDGSGCINSAARNVDCAVNSKLLARNTSQALAPDWSGAGEIGVRISNGSMGSFDGAKINGCGTFNLSVADGCLVNATDVDLSGGLAVGLGISGPSVVSISGGSVANCGTYGIQAYGGIVAAKDGVSANGCGTAGILAENGAVVNVGTDTPGTTLPFTATGCPVGIKAIQGAVVNAQQADVSGCTSQGVYADMGGHIVFSQGTANNCGTGIFANSSSEIVANDANATGCTVGIAAYRGSRVHAQNANVSGATSVGIDALEGSHVSATSANARRGTADGPLDIRIRKGSTVSGHGLTGGLSIPANVLTPDGSAYKAGPSPAWSPPTSMPAPLPFDLLRNSDGSLSHNYDFTQWRTLAGTTLYVSDAGSDSWTGTTQQQPLKSFTKAVELAAAGTGDYTIRLLDDVFRRPYGASAAFTLTGRKLSIIGSGAPSGFSWLTGALGVATWEADGANTWKTARSNVTAVYSATAKDAHGVPVIIPAAADLATCQATANTWFTDNTSVWINTGGTAPTINTYHVAVGAIIFRPTLAAGATVYIENVGMMFSTAESSTFTSSDNTGTLIGNGCKFIGGSGASGNAYNTIDLRASLQFGSVAAHGIRDGFNYHAAGVAVGERPKCLALEYNCVAYGNGVASPATNNNASTAHEGITVLRVGGDYSTPNIATTGPVIADVNGCWTGAYRAKVSRPTTGNGFEVSDASVAHLWNCESIASAPLVAGSTPTTVYGALRTAAPTAISGTAITWATPT